MFIKAVIIAPTSMNKKNVRYLKFEEHSSIYNFIPIPNLFSKFKSDKNYGFILSGWYLRRKKTSFQ
jgi:hypothetical protein